LNYDIPITISDENRDGESFHIYVLRHITVSSLCLFAVVKKQHERATTMAGIDKNVFVSHIHEDDAEVGKLKGLLEKQGFTIRDYSVTKDNPNNAHDEDYIKQAILKPRLDASSVVAVIVTPDTKDSDWVDWEVEYAVEHEKHIVGIWANGHSECEAPQSLEDYADAFVSWHSDKIINALEGGDYEEDCTGVPRPQRQLKPPKC